jgi:ParB family chromosome partitioning protein
MAKPSARVSGQYRMVSPDLIDENPKNPNKQSKFTFAKLKASILEFGFNDPLIVRRRGGRFEVVGGAHRLNAARDLGLTEVPVIDMGDMSDAAANKLLIVLNETRGSPDHDALAALIQDIKEDEGDASLSVLPYTEAELKDLLDDIADDDDPGLDDEGAPPDTKPAKLKPADVALAFEMEGTSQEDIRGFLSAFRDWRRKQSTRTPAWQSLLRLLEQST